MNTSQLSHNTFAAMAKRSCAYSIAALSLLSLIFQSTCLAQTSLDDLGTVFESKQTRYEREAQERRKAEAEQRQLEESLRQQQEEMRRIEAEKQRLLSGAPSTYSNQQHNQASTTTSAQLYVVADCAPCLKMLGLLDALDVQYEIREVDTSLSTERLYRERFGQGAMPVLETPAGVVRGYNPFEVKRLFNMQCSSQPRSATPYTSNKSASTKKVATGSTTAPAQASPLGKAATTTGQSDFDVSGTLNESE